MIADLQGGTLDGRSIAFAKPLVTTALPTDKCHLYQSYCVRGHRCSGPIVVGHEISLVETDGTTLVIDDVIWRTTVNGRYAAIARIRKLDVLNLIGNAGASASGGRTIQLSARHGGCHASHKAGRSSFTEVG